MINNNTDKTLDFVFTRSRRFSFTITLWQKPKGVTCIFLCLVIQRCIRIQKCAALTLYCTVHCMYILQGCAVMTFVLYSTFYVHFAGLCCDDKFCCINALLVCLYCRNIYILLCKPHPLYINGHIYRPATLNRAGKIYNKGYSYTAQRKAKDIITQSRERQRI